MFYDALHKYWKNSYIVHELQEFEYIGKVLPKIGQTYTDEGTIGENVKHEKAEEALEKCVHILDNIWTIPRYREIMGAEKYNNKEKYKFVKWMEAPDQVWELEL